jgi:hypothetical protein
MTLSDLKAWIKELEQQGATGDTEVRIAEQPNYPFEYSISGVRFKGTNDDDLKEAREVYSHDNSLTEDERRECLAEIVRMDVENVKIIYLLEGSQLGYVNRSLWDE